MTSRGTKSTYKLRNPHKYVGDNLKDGRVEAKSGLERRFMKFCDCHKSVLEWNYEGVVIKYISVDGKVHRYIIDFWVKTKKVDGTEECTLIEIKPKSQTVPPKERLTNKTRKPTKRYIEEAFTFAKNKCKWKQASEFADKFGMRFRVMTEDELV